MAAQRGNGGGGRKSGKKIFSSNVLINLLLFNVLMNLKARR